MFFYFFHFRFVRIFIKLQMFDPDVSGQAATHDAMKTGLRNERGNSR